MVPTRDTETMANLNSALTSAMPAGAAGRLPAGIPSPATAPSAAAMPLAEITSIPSHEARRVLSPANRWIATALTLSPIPIGLLGGIGLVVLGISFANVNQGITAVCVASGLLTGVACLLTLLHVQKLAASRYLRSVARRAFAGRTGALVRFEDPEAEFMEIVPRHNWHTYSLEPASDIGLARIDRSRRELLIEGDVKRYRIPFDSVTKCEVEEIRFASDQWATDLYFAVVLEAETTEGSRELPLFSRHLELASRRMLQRKRQADLLCERIREAIA